MAIFDEITKRQIFRQLIIKIEPKIVLSNVSQLTTTLLALCLAYCIHIRFIELFFTVPVHIYIL